MKELERKLNCVKNLAAYNTGLASLLLRGGKSGGSVLRINIYLRCYFVVWLIKHWFSASTFTYGATSWCGENCHLCQPTNQGLSQKSFTHS